jgi:hypothetical protein
MIFRGLTVPIMLAVAATGCTPYGVSGPEDLGLAARIEFDPQKLPIALTPGDSNPKLSRNELLSRWVVRSDFLCADYQLKLSRSIRDTRLATDFLATVLAGLATIFAQPAVTRPLAGAATIALGVGGDIQSDLFLQQAGDVVGTAIQAVRTRARIELQKKFTADYADYTLEQGLADVQRYDRETCNLNVGLNEIRASLNIVGPVAPQANDPIVPLPLLPAGTGAGPSAASATSGGTIPMASITIPPIVQKTPEGGFLFTPGKTVTVPASAAAAAMGAPTGAGSTSSPGVGPGSTSSLGVGPGSTSRPAVGLGATSKGLPSGGEISSAQPQFITGGRNEEERKLPLRQGKRIQSKLCLEPTGVFGRETYDAIQAWRADNSSTPLPAPLGATEPPPLNATEITDLLGLPDCKREFYRSPFEQAEYGTERRVMNLQRDLSAALKKAGGTTSVPQDGKLSAKPDDPTRRAIREFQELKRLPQTGIMTGATLDAIAN